ncbi:Ig-like domain repeat protein [Cellulomonas hominis]
MKSLAALTAGALLAGAGAVALAGSAAAADEGQLLPGNILWAKAGAYGNFDTLTAADQVWSGASPTEGVNPRPAGAILLDQTCPTDTVQVQAYIRLPQTGVPVNDWDMVSVTGASFTQDSQGRFYMSNTASSIDRLSKPQVFTRNATLPNQTGDYPFIVTCRDNNGIGRGYFEETITFTGIEATNYSWSITHDAWPTVGDVAQATSTTLATPTISGSTLSLSATVTPAGAVGHVEFFDGATSLGTADVTGGTAALDVAGTTTGAHSYTATFVPTDSAAYAGSTSPAVPVQISVLESGDLSLTLSVPGAPVGPGALTLHAPTATSVALQGARDSGNTVVSATATLPDFTVEDTRSAPTTWQVNVQAADFTLLTSTISAKYLGWTPTSHATIPEGGTLALQNGPAVPSAMDETASKGLAASQLFAKATTAGPGTTTLGATLNFKVPASAVQEGDYASKLTVTLISE